MSAEAWVAFYGVKLELGEDDEPYDPSHPLTSQIKKHGLEWETIFYPDASNADNFIVVLMVGRKIGDFGWEGLRALDFSEDDLQMLASEVKPRLRHLGIDTAPRLWLVFQPDDF